MAPIGRLTLDISLDYDQSLPNEMVSTIDGRKWTRLTEYSTYDIDDLNMPADNLVLAAQYSYGRDRFIIGEFQTGLATVVLNNDTGEWSPESGVNYIGGDKLEPGMFVRIGFYTVAADVETYLEAQTSFTWTTTGAELVHREATDAETVTGTVDGRTWTAHVNTPGDVDVNVYLDAWVHKFTGRIYYIQDRYEPGGQGSTTVLHIADVMGDLSQYDDNGASSRSAETTHARLTFIAATALSALNSIQADGIYNIEASTLDSNYLTEARKASAAEGGAVFADHGRNGGGLRNYDANWLIEDDFAATIQQRLGTTYIGLTDAAPNYSLTRIFNNLYYTNSSTTSNQSDATSIAAYGNRTLKRDVLNNDNTDLTSIATRDLAILKNPQSVVEQVTIRPTQFFEQIWCGATQAALNIGNLLEVTVENRDWSYTQNLHIAGIGETFDAASGDWTVNLRLDARDGDTVIS